MSFGLRFSFFLTVCLSLFTPNLSAQKQDIQNVLNEVHLDSLLFSVKQLTGIEPVELSNQTRTINSRFKDEPGNAWAAQYLGERLKQYGYNAVYQNFNASGQNVYAVKEGSLFPDQAFVICAHYDAIAIPYDQAIGADDNASGCAAVLEAARLFRDKTLPYTLIFIFFDEEEQGMIGSYAFNSRFDFDEYAIKAVINIDMIGYDNNLDYKADIHTRPYAQSNELAYKMVELNDTFSIGLTLNIRNPGTTASDHSPFWENNISAILLIEDALDFNRYYHTKFDSIQYFHDSFFYKNTQLALATLGWLAWHEDDILSVKNFTKKSIKLYPNPGRGNFVLESFEEGILSIYSSNGQLMSQMEVKPGLNNMELPPHITPGLLWFKLDCQGSMYSDKYLFLQP